MHKDHSPPKIALLTNNSWVVEGVRRLFPDVVFHYLNVRECHETLSGQYRHHEKWVIIPEAFLDDAFFEGVIRQCKTDACDGNHVLIVEISTGQTHENRLTLNSPVEVWRDKIAHLLSKPLSSASFRECNFIEKSRISLLTPSEIMIVKYLLKGHSNRDVAKIMNISEKTVGVHKLNALRKLGIRRLTPDLLPEPKLTM